MRGAEYGDDKGWGQAMGCDEKTCAMVWLVAGKGRVHMAAWEPMWVTR